MFLGLGWWAHEIYQNYCTKATRSRRHQRRVWGLLQDLAKELRNVGSPGDIELNQFERRLEEISD